MPLFSIVIPCFNAAKTLPATLESLRAQTLSDWEAIIVNDGCTDETCSIVDALSRDDPRISIQRNAGKGPSEARTNGVLQFATGTYIAFCDADDIWHPRKLADVAAKFRDPQIDATFGQIAFFQKDPKQIRTYSTVPDHPVTVPDLLGENPVCTMSNLSIRREVFEALGGFAPDMVHNEDLEWLIRLVANGYMLSGIEQLHVYYRTSVNGLSANLTAMKAGRERAVATACAHGFAPDARAEAVHLRYLARRALRIGARPVLARQLALQGLVQNPVAFLSPPRRGVATALAAMAAPALPAVLRRYLFTH